MFFSKRLKKKKRLKKEDKRHFSNSSSRNTHNRLRYSKVAQHRRKVRVWLGVLIVVGVILLINLISWFSYANIIAVQTLSVSGNKQLSTLSITSHILKMTKTPYLVFFSQNNIFSFPTRRVRASLRETFPRIKIVHVKTDFLQRTVSVHIVERVPYALLCKSISNNDCYFLDENGYIYENANLVSATSTKYIIFENTQLNSKKFLLRNSVSVNYFSNIKKFIQILSVRGYTIKDVMIKGTDAIVTIAPGWQVKIALDNDVSIAAHNLLDVIEKSSVGTELNSIKYIDMRFNRRVYYKYKD